MAQAKLLIAEDDWFVAEDTKNRLEDLGYDVSALVSSGEEAIFPILTPQSARRYPGH